MSAQVIEVPDFKKLLRDGHRASGLSVSELWFRYRSAGGKRSESALKTWFSRKPTLPDIDQYVIVVGVINQRLEELGSHQLPELRGRDSNPQPTGYGLLAA